LFKPTVLAEYCITIEAEEVLNFEFVADLARLFIAKTAS
jgi:hypothetical protein